MKTMTSTGKVWMILVALLGMAVLGTGPALAQQAVTPAPMKSMKVKPVTKAVPDVIGKPLSEARKILKKAGFTKVEIKGTRAKDARVQTQKPKGGENAPLNARVVLRTALQKARPLTAASSTTGGKPGISTEAMPKRWDPGDFSPSSGAVKRKSAKKPGEVIIVGSKLKAASAQGSQEGKGALSTGASAPGIGTSPRAVQGAGEQCPDPAAHRIEVELLSKEGQFRGRVRITGVIKNLGSLHWVPVVYGQRLQVKLRIGGRDSRIGPDRRLDGLAAGGEVKISHEMDWNAAAPSSANKRFYLSVTDTTSIPTRNRSDYKPECNRWNNEKEITGAAINALFPPTSGLVKISNYSLRVLKNELRGRGRLSVTLGYKKRSKRETIRITASVAPPHAGEASTWSIDGRRIPQHINGQADMTVQLECNGDPESASTVTIKYELKPLLIALPQGSSWQSPVATATQTLRYAGALGVCGPGLPNALPPTGSTAQ